MISRRSVRIAVLAAILPLCADGVPARAEEASAGNDFFEKKIRPVLIEHCYKCHSATSEKIKGKLRVDSRAALLKGGESGPTIVPGSPEKSLLIEAVVYTNQDLQMPPKNKLSETVIQDFTNWVKAGAPWPDEKESGKVVEEKKLDYDKLRREHWAFQPVKHYDVPPVKDEAWPAGVIDRFTLAKLEAKNLKPAKAAEKHALLRRVTFDLIGLPPTPEEINAFIQDETPGAFGRIVERLLTSPHFGERWGRHWLDIARYAESAGGGRVVPYPNAGRYRDYVIAAFNNDKPYDEFLAQQIAGDLLPATTLEQRRENIIATGFLAVASKNLDTQDKDLLRMDVVDEQIDTLGKAFLGMTLGCARCHDHKFDPVPTRDYYALAGIFRSTKTLTPGNVSGVVQAVLPSDPAMLEKIAEYEKRIAAMEDRLHKLRTGDRSAKPADTPAKPADAPVAAKKFKSKVDAASLPGIVMDNAEANINGTWIKSTHTQVFVGEGYLHDNGKSKGEMSVSFAPSLPKAGAYEVRLSYSPAATRPERVPVIIQHGEGETTVYVNEREEPAIEGLFVSLGRFRFHQGNDGSVTVSNMGTDGVVTVDAVQFLPLDEAVAQILADSQARKPVEAVVKKPKSKAEEEVEALKKLEAEIKEAKKSAPAGPMALAVRDEERVGDYNICVRGDVHRLGDAVQRGFLSLASYEAPPVNPAESGRAELAKWVVDKRNPLTARVMVNRLWHHLFGAGLVRSTDNFGVTGEKPSHPELLDFLAERFVEKGWSVKTMIRDIVLSRTYQQAAAENPAAAKTDPQNRLLWRANRRRLQVEPMRDAILANSGALDLSIGGSEPAPKTEKSESGKSNRRTVYVALKREAIDDMLEIFDFADTNLVVGNRNTSNLPTQSLFLMNSPFAIEQSRKAAERLLSATDLDDKGRIRLAYLRALGRPPSTAELGLSQKFLSLAGSAEAAKVWGQFYQTLMGCVDFRYLE